MLVRDLMMPTVLTVSPRDTVGDVDRAMRERGDTAAIVTEDERVVGLFTEKELAQVSNDGVVSDQMAAPCATIEPGSSLTDAARTMTEWSQRFLPVVDDGLLVGILSLTDMRRWARSGSPEGNQEAQQLLTLLTGGSQPPPA
jgi:IMP dehydrogenase